MTKSQLSVMIDRALENERIAEAFRVFKESLLSGLDQDMNYALPATVHSYVSSTDMMFDRGVKDAVINGVCDSFPGLEE